MTVDARPRAPAVAGRFYPGTPEAIRRQLRGLTPDVAAAPAIAAMAPHAGWVYSGAIAAETWARIEVPSRVILLCPNHTGRGVRRSVWSGGAWSVPGGEIPIDDTLTRALVDEVGLTPDRAAHEQEHSIEVHLPLMQARRPDVKMAAVCLAGLDVAACEAIGERLAAVVSASAEPPLLMASSDMSHYLPADEAAELDKLALRRVLDLDPAGLLATVRAHSITMCGVLPMTVAMFAAKALGATEATLVRYGNSGEHSGDYERVVGYAGVVIR